MASILRNFFSSKSSTGTFNPHIKGLPYDSAIALDPPVKGSYPVTGNGPHVLEDIQRSRTQKVSSSARRPSGAAPPPNVPRYRDDTIPRPQTAPNDGGLHNNRRSRGGSLSWVGRTSSGFSSKSPPSVFRSSSRYSRRNDSLRSNIEHPVPPLPSQYDTPTRKPGPGSEVPVEFTPPFTQHQRTGSNASHKSHVDLLEAHSSIRPEISKHRAKASGVRNHGEDVADRNISRSKPANPKNAAPLDLDSPQFSYMKTVYAPEKEPAAADVAGASKTRPADPRISSALGHVLGEDGPSDDIRPRSHGQSPSIRSATLTPAARTYSFRAETTSSFHVVSSATVSEGRALDRDRPSSSSQASPSQDQRSVASIALSPLSHSNTSHSTPNRPIMRETLRKLLHPKQNPRQSLEEPETRTQTFGEKFLREPPPSEATISRPPHVLPRELPQDDTFATPASNSSVDHGVKRKPTLPVGDESSVHSPVSIKSPTSSEHKKSKNGSVSYSTFPNTSNRPGNNYQTDRLDFAARSPSLSKTNNRQGMILENSSVPPNLDGIVDLTNTVDTEVITKTLPAVTHEHVTPVQHEIRQERIFREIHTHEVRHHILPVIDTQILPSKHYIMSPDGKSLIEIPEPQVPAHKLTGRMNGNWSLSRTPLSGTRSDTQDAAYHQSMSPVEHESAPVIGLARGEPSQDKSRSRANFRTSNPTVKPARSSRNLFTEPILISKKEYMTPENFPRTEYLWRHPPVFEDALGRTQPIIMGAGFGDPNAPRDQFFEDRIMGVHHERGAVRHQREEDDLMFRDSGYGSQGMLLGLSSMAPISSSLYSNASGSRHSNGHVEEIQAVGRAQTASHAERDARRGHGMNGIGGSHMQEREMIRGMNGLSV
ncbi:uncharacterized protein RCO7_01320 [Rhynchosporium graminicola]|uniref:Uncharacterized protein n=1 Tax=Rhynchosporium graminicola TaxID=2792576 RepID=A0A1E1LLG3_9HELO|nr:uncharacterized protein RCO7_01320 [Rhynchosporium commune]